MDLERIKSKIITVQEQQVILDSDIAALYNVETKRINEAVKNNPDKFPEGYIVSLTTEEWSNLKSKISTSSLGGKNKLPNAFSERGLYMLATIGSWMSRMMVSCDVLAILPHSVEVSLPSKLSARLVQHQWLTCVNSVSRCSSKVLSRNNGSYGKKSYLCQSNTSCLKNVKNEVNLNTLRVTYPFPSSRERLNFHNRNINDLRIKATANLCPKGQNSPDHKVP